MPTRSGRGHRPTKAAVAAVADQGRQQRADHLCVRVPARQCGARGCTRAKRLAGDPAWWVVKGGTPVRRRSGHPTELERVFAFMDAAGQHTMSRPDRQHGQPPGAQGAMHRQMRAHAAVPALHGAAHPHRVIPGRRTPVGGTSRHPGGPRPVQPMAMLPRPGQQALRVGAQHGAQVTLSIIKLGAQRSATGGSRSCKRGCSRWIMSGCAGGTASATSASNVQGRIPLSLTVGGVQQPTAGTHDHGEQLAQRLGQIAHPSGTALGGGEILAWAAPHLSWASVRMGVVLLHGGRPDAPPGAFAPPAASPPDPAGPAPPHRHARMHDATHWVLPGALLRPVRRWRGRCAAEALPLPRLNSRSRNNTHA